jgi:hypothetical protein
MTALIEQRSALVVSPEVCEAVGGSPADNTPGSATNTVGVLSIDDAAAYLLLIQQMRAVICDFMPNIGRCVLQDYALLNKVLCDSRDMLFDAGMVIPEARK